MAVSRGSNDPNDAKDDSQKRSGPELDPKIASPEKKAKSEKTSPSPLARIRTPQNLNEVFNALTINNSPSYISAVNSLFSSIMRAQLGFIALFNNATLPGAKRDSLSKLGRPSNFLSFGTTAKEQESSIDILKNVHGPHVALSSTFYVLYAKDGRLYTDTFISTIMPDYLCISKGKADQTPDVILRTPPKPLKDGMYAYVVVLTAEGFYQFRVSSTSTGATNHPRMWCSATEKMLASGELYYYNNKVVMLNDKTGNYYSTMMHNTRELKLTEPLLKLVADAFIPLDCRATPSIDYNWNAVNENEIYKLLKQEVCAYPLELIVNYLKSFDPYQNGVEPVVVEILSDHLGDLINRYGTRGKINTPQMVASMVTFVDGIFQSTILPDLLIKISQLCRIPIDSKFDSFEFKGAFIRAVEALGYLDNYHIRMNEILLMNTLKKLGVPRTEKMFRPLPNIPTPVSFMAEPPVIEPSTPSTPDLSGSYLFFSSSSSSIASTSSTDSVNASPLIPPSAP